MAKLVISITGGPDEGPVTEEELQQIEGLIGRIREGKYVTFHREPDVPASVPEQPTQ